MNRLTRTVLTAALMAAPAALILTGCAKSAPDSVLLPAVQETPSPTSPAYTQAMRDGMPFGMLLRHRSELGLTDAQIAQLAAIRTRLQQQNQPLLAQLREAGVMPRGDGMRAGMRQMTPEQRQEMRARMQQMTPEQRQEMRARMHEQRAQAAPRTRAGAERQVPEYLRPVARQIQENTRAALHEARAVLTPEQQEQMRELMQEHRRSLMERRGATRGERGPRGIR